MAIKTITVSQLKCACLDTEWRRQWIAGKNPTTLIGKSDKTPVYGHKFHKIVEQYSQRLISDLAGETKDWNDIQHWNDLYERFAENFLNGILDAGKVESAYHLTQCLKSFCRRLIELKNRTRSFQSWQDVFITKEYAIKDVPFQIGNDFIFISGQMDAVRSHPVYGLEIVDYKLSHGDNLQHDLIQIAVYSKLLSITKPGIVCQGILEYYEPELHETLASASELDGIFDEMVMPVLQELIGTENSFVTQQTPDKAPSSKPSDLSQQIRDAFHAFKLSVDVLDRYEAPQVVRYQVKPASGVKVVSLVNRADDLQVALSLKQRPLIEPAQGCVTIDIPKENPDMVYWKDIVKQSAYLSHPSPVSFPVGVGVNNQIILADLADPNMCHALVAGAAGSGKSQFLKAVTASLIFKNKTEPNKSFLKLTLIDPKILTFGGLVNCPFLTAPVITNLSSAIPQLHKAVAEMDRRYHQLKDEQFENLSERFKAGKTDLPFYVIIFDEFADLILSGKEEKKEFETLVSRLTAKGRAAGIHLILSTQRPDHKIVTGLIKANLPLKVCFRVTSSTNSQIILDQNGGESLTGKGDLLCDLGKGVERAQAPFISQEELMSITKNDHND